MTESGTAEANALVEFNTNIPPTTFVAPVNEFVPAKIRLPPPSFVRPPAPESVPAKVTLFVPVSTWAEVPAANALNFVLRSVVKPGPNWRTPPPKVNEPVPTAPAFWTLRIPPVRVVPPV